MSDYDSPWKEALDVDFKAFLEFFFPKVFALVDWNRDVESLDKELQQIIREAEVTRRYVDKLFKVWLLDGQEAWLLIHVEFQAQYAPDFPERMFVYNYRLYDRHRRPVISLAVLGDDRPKWRPKSFGYSLGGSTMSLKYPVVKLLDYRRNLEALETSSNPVAHLVLAHLKTMETQQDAEARRVWKFRVIRGLYERGFTADQVRQWLRLIDWMMDLPEELEAELRQDLSQLEEEKQMPYVTSFERLARNEGIAFGKAEGKAEGKVEGKAEGKAEALLQLLEWHFPGQVPTDVNARIRGTSDLAQLEQWFALALQAQTVEEFRQAGQL